MGVISSLDCAKGNSEVESGPWAGWRWLWKGVAGKQAPGLFLALPGMLCDPGQVFSAVLCPLQPQCRELCNGDGCGAVLQS